ncbi:pre-toxin TG domain-containing protein, partial [Bacillus sp. 179-C3.3 HS]|uniref:pre-toxin TG domain-containing protein n=1 Tax=Bacillus sp. 179-C3.3 HS TaxID=3232162 RepID=UPI0039A0B904
AAMINATNNGKSISPMNFDKKAYQNSEIYKIKDDIEKQTAEYIKIKKEQEEARKIAKEQEALANRPWHEKALDYGGMLVNELTGVNDAQRAATGVDPITGEQLTSGQRVAAGGMAAAGYIPVVGWAGRIFKGGKAIYKTSKASSAAVSAVDIYKSSQKSFDALKTAEKGLYGITAANGFSEAIIGRDMFGNKISKEQQQASMDAALGALLPFGVKGFHGKMGVKSNGQSENKSPSEIARSWQGQGAYPGIDKYRDISLKRGTVIYRGEPFGSEYFTTGRAIQRSGNDARALFEGLQVQKHPQFGYRPGMTAYVVDDKIEAAFGITKANPQYGTGNLPQMFVPDANELIEKGILKPIESQRLTNFK